VEWQPETRPPADGKVALSAYHIILALSWNITETASLEFPEIRR
jgi:hypothetical protein